MCVCAYVCTHVQKYMRTSHRKRVVVDRRRAVFVLFNCLMRARLRQGIGLLVCKALRGLVAAAVLTSAGRHIPYRDSKLTRMLQDSLGGNSYTDSWLLRFVLPGEDVISVYSQYGGDMQSRVFTRAQAASV